MARSIAGFKAVAAILAVGVLAACGTSSAATKPTASNPAPSTVQTPANVMPKTGLPDPKTIDGPSTANTVAEVVPITADPQPTLPVTVTDERGNSITVTDTSRILALDVYGTLAETIVGLGLGDQLVGRGASNALERMAELPLVTQNGHELNAEAILKLNPTVILTDTTLGPREVQDQLSDSGIPVVFFNPKRELGTVTPQIQAVAHAVGLDAEGKQLADRVRSEIEDAVAEIAAMAPQDPAKKLRIVFLYMRGQSGVFFIFGAGSGADTLISSLGAVDVATDGGITGTKPVNSEALMAANPDVYLVMTDGLKSAGGIEGLLKKPGVAETTAGRKKRVVDMTDAQIISFGPTSADVLLSLASAVYDPEGKSK